MEPLPIDNCAYCDGDIAFYICEYCDTLYCSDECSAADHDSHQHFCLRLHLIGQQLKPLLVGHGWVFPDPNLSVFHEDVIKTYPGTMWHAAYIDFLKLIALAAYLFSQMGGRAARAKALDIFTKLAKAPVLLNRRTLNRIIPALQIEFGYDEIGGWPTVRDAKLRNLEQIQVRKGKTLAPRLVCPEDEWYHSHDPGLVGIRILLQMKTIWALEDMRNSCLLDSKLVKELEMEMEKNIVEPATWERLNRMKIVHDLGSASRLGNRIRKLRQRIRKNIRKVHAQYPYFFPAFSTNTPNLLLDLHVDEFYPKQPLTFFLGHECGWQSCYDHAIADMHVTQVAFKDIYGAYASTPGAIEALRGFLETSVDWLVEIEPYLQELDAYELATGDELAASRADNADRMAPIYQW